MKTPNPLSLYLDRLCQLASEKAFFNDNDDAQFYFNQAFLHCQSSEDFLLVFKWISGSKLENKEYLAYYALYKALDSSEDSVAYMFNMIRHPEFATDINNLLQLFPDPMYHYLLKKAKDKHEKTLVACMFLPHGNFISDPDPEMVLQNNNYSADAENIYWKKAC